MSILIKKSKTKKYNVEFIELTSDLYKESELDHTNMDLLGKGKYIRVNLVRNCDTEIIYSYIQKNEIYKPVNKFILINGEDWWFGGKTLEYKLIINLNEIQVFDESIHLNILDDSSKTFKWCDITVSRDSNTLLVYGYNTKTRNLPGKYRLFDISSIFEDGINEILLKNKFDLYEYEKDGSWVVYEFYDNNSIIKKKLDFSSDNFVDTDVIIRFK